MKKHTVRNVDVRTVDHGTLQGIKLTVEAEIERRKGWPTRLVYLVWTHPGWQRFHDLDQALTAFRASVVHHMDTASEWQRRPDSFGPNEVKFAWMVESYDPKANISRQTPTASGGSLDGVVGGSE